MDDAVAYDNNNGDTSDPDVLKSNTEPISCPFTEECQDSNNLNLRNNVNDPVQSSKSNQEEAHGDSDPDMNKFVFEAHSVNDEDMTNDIAREEVYEEDQEAKSPHADVTEVILEEQLHIKDDIDNMAKESQGKTIEDFDHFVVTASTEQEIVRCGSIHSDDVQCDDVSCDDVQCDDVSCDDVPCDDDILLSVCKPITAEEIKPSDAKAAQDSLEVLYTIENTKSEKADRENVVKIQELEVKVQELECSCKEKDATITNLQGEIEKLNSELKSRSVPTAKKPTGATTDHKAKSVGAKRTTTRPASGAKAVPNGGEARKGAVSPIKRPPSSTGTRPTKPAATRPAPAKPAATKPAATGGKKTGKAPNRVEMAKGHDGEEHAVKLTLRGRGIVCYPPTDFKMEDISSEKPEENLSIRWVYGYRGRDSQDNIFCLPTNELLYFQAAVGIIYNPETRSQRFYQGHNDDIKCIALNPANPSIVATGQAAGHDEKEGDPHVRVWNCETLETLAVLGLGVLQRAVGSVSFSPDGTRILAVDEGNDHTIYVYDWKKKSQVACQKGHQDPVLGAEFVPSCNNKFITYGKGHIIFWEVEGNKLVKKSGLFEKHAKPRFITSLAFNSKGEPVSGDSNGNLYLWNPNERKITKAKMGLHEGSVYSIAVNGDEIYTGGQDCKIKKVNADDLSDIDTWQLDEDTHARVRAIAFVGDNIAVGTYNNGMLFGKFGDDIEQIIYGHGAGDLWGGAVHPVDNSFATVGQDKVVYIWDAEAHVPKHIFKVEKPAQSCAFSPDGSVLAVASTTGEWWVLDSSSGDVLSSYKSGPEQIDAISYSPDSKVIAVGSHDNITYLYSCEDLKSEYKAVGKCSGHSSFITHLDFSDDGKTLQTTSGDYEHLFWETETGDQVTNCKELRDVTMATYTCILGFPVCGIWPVGYDGTDINSLSRSHDSNLVATADDFGLVNLFRYPCCDPTAAWSSFRGHSAHVTKVRFLNGDKELFSLGGRDQSIIQWAIC